MFRSDVDRLVALNDSALEELIRSSADSAVVELERVVVNAAWPVIEPILSRYARSRTLATLDAEDVASAINLRLVRKLQKIAQTPEEAVTNFEKYVATLTYNAVNDHLRRRFPERARLKNRLRYLLEQDERFELSVITGETVCGLRNWRSVATPPLLDAMIPRDDVTAAMLNVNDGTSALHAVLSYLGQPVWMNSLVTVFAVLWNVVEPETVATAGWIASRETDTSARMETREYLGALWDEVRSLRPIQRMALLLNLRDGETVNVISLLVWSGIAAFDEIAHTLEMSPEQLAAIWQDLPLGDLQIGEMLGITRQQVINLRKSARARLRRRMGR